MGRPAVGNRKPAESGMTLFLGESRVIGTADRLSNPLPMRRALGGRLALDDSGYRFHQSASVRVRELPDSLDPTMLLCGFAVSAVRNVGVETKDVLD